MNTLGSRLFAASVALMIVLSGRALGGISLVAQTDEVQISGRTSAPDGSARGTPFSESQAATVGVPFSASLQNTSTATLSVRATASASQTSLLSVDSQSLGLTATGQASFGAGDIGSEAIGSSSYYIVFSVDAATPYTLNESTSQQGYTSSDDGDLGAFLFPGQQGNGTLPTGVNSLVPDLTAVKYFNAGPQSFSGTLSAGTYTLEGDIYAGGGPNNGASGSYSIDFALGSSSAGSGSGGSGAGGTAVPLPAAFWPATGVLVMIGVGLSRRRAGKRNAGMGSTIS